MWYKMYNLLSIQWMMGYYMMVLLLRNTILPTSPIYITMVLIQNILVYRVTDGVPYHTHIFQLYYSHSIIIWSYYDACGGSVWCVLLYTKLQFMFNDIWSLNIIFSIIYVNLSLQGINLRVIKSRDIFVYIPIPRIYRLVLYIFIVNKLICIPKLKEISI